MNICILKHGDSDHILTVIKITITSKQKQKNIYAKTWR